MSLSRLSAGLRRSVEQAALEQELRQGPGPFRLGLKLLNRVMRLLDGELRGFDLGGSTANKGFSPLEHSVLLGEARAENLARAHRLCRERGISVSVEWLAFDFGRAGSLSADPRLVVFPGGSLPGFEGTLAQAAWRLRGRAITVMDPGLCGLGLGLLAASLRSLPLHLAAAGDGEPEGLERTDPRSGCWVRELGELCEGQGLTDLDRGDWNRFQLWLARQRQRGWEEAA